MLTYAKRGGRSLTCLQPEPKKHLFLLQQMMNRLNRAEIRKLQEREVGHWNRRVTVWLKGKEFHFSVLWSVTMNGHFCLQKKKGWRLKKRSSPDVQSGFAPLTTYFPTRRSKWKPSPQCQEYLVEGNVCFVYLLTNVWYGWMLENDLRWKDQGEIKCCSNCLLSCCHAKGLLK